MRVRGRTLELTVFIQEVVLDVLGEEVLDGLADLLLLLGDVLVILGVVSLGDGWGQTWTLSSVSSSFRTLSESASLEWERGSRIITSYYVISDDMSQVCWGKTASCHTARRSFSFYFISFCHCF